MILEAGKALAADDSPATAAAYKAARAAQGLLYSGLGLIEDAHRTMVEQHGSTVVVDGQQIRAEVDDIHKQQMANAMADAFAAVAKKFDSHLHTVTETQEMIEAAIAKQMQPPKADSVAASDLRKVVIAQADPMGYLAGALADDDFEIVMACLTTSPRASGLRKEQWLQLKEMAAEIMCPRETAHLQAIKNVRSALLRSASIFTTKYGERLPIVKPTAANVARERLKEGVK
jgi:hypothetical protein